MQKAQRLNERVGKKRGRARESKKVKERERERTEASLHRQDSALVVWSGTPFPRQPRFDRAAAKNCLFFCIVSRRRGRSQMDSDHLRPRLKQSAWVRTHARAMLVPDGKPSAASNSFRSSLGLGLSPSSGPAVGCSTVMATDAPGPRQLHGCGGYSSGVSFKLKNVCKKISSRAAWPPAGCVQ